MIKNKKHRNGFCLCSPKGFLIATLFPFIEIDSRFSVLGVETDSYFSMIGIAVAKNEKSSFALGFGLDILKPIAKTVILKA